MYRSCKVWPLFFEDKPKMISFVFIVQKISRIFYIVSQTTSDAKKQITY